MTTRTLLLMSAFLLSVTAPAFAFMTPAQYDCALKYAHHQTADSKTTGTMAVGLNYETSPRAQVNLPGQNTPGLNYETSPRTQSSCDAAPVNNFDRG